MADHRPTVLKLEPPGDLLRGPSHRKAVQGQLSERARALQLVKLAPSPGAGLDHRPLHLVADLGAAVAGQLAGDRCRSPAKGAGNGSARFTVCMQTVNLAPLIQAELIVSLSHRNTHYSGCCTSIVSLGTEGNAQRTIHASANYILGRKPSFAATWTPAFAGVTTENGGLRVFPQPVNTTAS